jgi:hypothetical protein
VPEGDPGISVLSFGGETPFNPHGLFRSEYYAPAIRDKRKAARRIYGALMGSARMPPGRLCRCLLETPAREHIRATRTCPNASVSLRIPSTASLESVME